tara:strand:+ start:545 stop:2458 length:1914 start_codon:yes stop_codon:yes gene_type:complete
MSKKKILFQSDFSLGKTGFGRNARALLKYLYETDKYEIVHYCCGTPYSEPFLKKTPWKSIGCLPDDPREREMLNKDPHMSKRASYGEYYLDKVIKEEKPDVYMAVQDIWGVDFSIKKPWFNKINSIIWTTLDSLPILPTAVEAAKKVKHYWIWSSFATDVLNEMGHDHVRTVHGIVDPKLFKRLSDKRRKQLREENQIDENEYVVGFVFRNQLRKSVPNLLEGFKKWKNRNRDANGKLLLHTHFGEGWNIMKLADEYNVDKSDILTTYVCKNCHKYSVAPFEGEEKDCPHCKAQKSMGTTSVGYGVTEEQLNEIYNLMDVYCHPFTSGGQEIPIQEAKLTELVTLVTDYSCGAEMCKDEACSLSLDWSEYREHGTEFIKASTNPNSIAKQLEKVYKMKPNKKADMGRKARDWVVNNFSPKVVGGFIENYIDNLPKINFDFSFERGDQNPNYVMPQIEDDEEWILHLYHNILNEPDIDKDDDGFKYWKREIKDKRTPREHIESYFRQVAANSSEKDVMTNFESLLGEDDAGKRIIYVMPESAEDVFLSTSLFESIKDLYPEHNLYVATQPRYFPILSANPHVYKTLPYSKQMESFSFLEGSGEDMGYFEIAFMPFVNTQRHPCYSHNGKDKLGLQLKN